MMTMMIGLSLWFFATRAITDKILLSVGYIVQAYMTYLDCKLPK